MSQNVRTILDSIIRTYQEKAESKTMAESSDASMRIVSLCLTLATTLMNERQDNESNL